MRAGYAQRVRAYARPLSVPWAEVGVVAAQAVALIPFSIVRPVDGDEGYYLFSSQLAMQGERLYSDFVFTQTPLLPYVYGAWLELTGGGWHAARLLSVLFAVALGLLLYRHVAARLGSRLGLAAVFCYLGSAFVFQWLTVVKTQALGTLLLFAAFALVVRDPPVGPRTWLGAGVLLALAVDTRLLFLAAVPAFAWLAGRRRRLPALAGGFVAGLVPIFVFLALDPGRFIFGTLGYHAARTTSGLVGDFEQKARVAANVLGIGEEGTADLLVLLLAAVAGALATFLLRRQFSFAFVVGGLLVVASFVPTPAYPQYLVSAIPFLIVAAVEGFAAIRSRASVAGDAPLRNVVAALGVVLALGYVMLAGDDIWRYATRNTGERIGPVERVAGVIDRNTRPGEQVLAAWPGFLFGTHAASVPGFENDFAPLVAGELSPDEIRRNRLVTTADLLAMIRDRRVRVVVPRFWHAFYDLPDLEGTAQRSGYRMLAQIEGTRVYVAPGG